MTRWLLLLLPLGCVCLYACAQSPRKSAVAPARLAPAATSQPAPKSTSKPTSRPTTAVSRPATTRAAAKADNPEPLDQAESPDNPVPFLTGQQEIGTFKLPPGFHVELVAEEPMVEHPIAMTFDPDGRIWVCEMRGYMPNPAGVGESEPTGRISVLEDTDGDGKMDKSTVFLDHLVMPRAIALANDGALVAVPPKLLFCRDTNGDGKSDQQTVVTTDYGDGKQPEHQANGLMYGIDNWIYSADYDKRWRFASSMWVSQNVIGGGQWGITQDDVGHIFYNTNSDFLRGNIVPSQYTIRNPHFPGSGANVGMAIDQNCWPAIASAVNRGYRATQLRDGRLRTFTAACSPVIYRGGIFPPEYNGNAFVCEPSANLIRRAVLTESDLNITATNPYDKGEFLTSTYERFRPVNLYTGPDGAMYVIDMHHGLLQHKAYLTPYLKNKYLKRELDQHLLTGRIFRIVPDGAKLNPKPQLSKATTTQLAMALGHPNGWWRDTAQRLLVERSERAALPILKQIIEVPPSKLGQMSGAPIMRIHALWTLDGMHRLDVATATIALRDPDPQVRATAIRVCEALLASPRKTEILPAILALAGDPDPHVRLQFALTVSEIATPEADNALARLLLDGDNRFIRDAAITGMRGRELGFAVQLLTKPMWDISTPGRSAVLESLARAVTAERNTQQLEKLLDVIASLRPANVSTATQSPSASASTHTSATTHPVAMIDQVNWKQAAVLNGIGAMATAHPPRKPVTFPAEPAALAAIKSSNDPAVAPALASAMKMIVWAGKPGYVAPPPPIPLTPQQQERFAAGQSVYGTVCIQCHKPDGMGQAGLAPPLVGSEWVLGPEERIVRIVLNGLRGPITVEGDRYNLDMPNLAALSNEQIAAALTFVRRSWDHDADPVEPQTVEKIRAETVGRKESWTAAELLKIAAPTKEAPTKEAPAKKETRAETSK